MSGIRILCVEDNKRVQEFNRFQFAEQGYAIDTAFTLASARESLTREEPQLIILDINMPDGDGRDFLRELRASDSALSRLPVLMLTGCGDDTDVVAGFESGCNDYLAKPYSFQVLLMRTKELLKRAEQSSGVMEDSFNKEKFELAAASLTETERRILRMIAMGYSNQEIGDKLHYAVSYVKKIAGGIYEKNNVSNRWEMKKLLR